MVLLLLKASAIVATDVAEKVYDIRSETGDRIADGRSKIQNCVAQVLEGVRDGVRSLNDCVADGDRQPD